MMREKKAQEVLAKIRDFVNKEILPTLDKKDRKEVVMYNTGVHSGGYLSALEVKVSIKLDY